LRLTEITAHRFRNLAPEPVSFGAGVTFLVGENAQGKTNLLEAIAQLCGQRSFRRAVPAEMAADGERFAVAGSVRRGFESEGLRVEWSRGLGRRFFRAEKPATFREVAAMAPAVFLAPEHCDLVRGAPALRRRFLDRLVLGARPAAGDDLARFERALKERNALLARVRYQGEAAPGELEAWTEELVRAGAAVRRHRREALEEWRPRFEELSREAGPEYAGIRAEYAADGQTEEDLRRSCAKLLPRERRRGCSLAGPHRDDLAWTRAGRPLAWSASSGEVHRTVTLAKLAEWHAVYRATGETPLFAADDFDAGLSSGAVRALLASLPEGATVLLTTAAEPSRYRHLAAGVLEIRAGAVALPARRAALDRRT
jgi:DNA replication and repair protein RecF